METTNLVAIFITGLVTGGLSCLAVQGGLLAATIAQREEQQLLDKARTSKALPIIIFLCAKLVAYTFLGLMLGWFGSFFQLSLTARIIMQIAVSVFMVGTALSILDVHPIFRYFIIQPPRFITKRIRRLSKNSDVFAPLLLGACTVFIPCGVTQAVMAVAIASGNPGLGALIMFAYILGTSPLFFTLGFFATMLSRSLANRFLKFASVAIIGLAIFNINAALNLWGSPFTLERAVAKVRGTDAVSASSRLQTPAVNTAATEATIYIDQNGYSPKQIVLQAGREVKLHLINTTGNNCAQAFTIPSMRLQKIIPVGTSDTLTFTTPQMSGQIAFMCGMGMYRGNIYVN